MTVRCYLSPSQWGEGEVRLSGREAHHLAKVLRLSRGDSLICSDGLGQEAPARVLQVSARGEVLLSVNSAWKLAEPAFQLSLAAAIPGQGKLDEIVNHATQLGVSRILPLITERTVVRASEAGSERKQERLRRIALEAVKQSGSGRVPEIFPPRLFQDLPSSFREYDRALLASVQGPWESLPVLLEGHGTRFLILIGPEGDFSPAEEEQAVRAGARRFSLGPAVLRCETACVAAVSIVSYELRSRG